MNHPLALPSPPAGVAAVSRHPLSFLRRALASGVAYEPGDYPARFAIAGSVLPTLVPLVGTLLGVSLESSFVWLTSVQLVPVWTVVYVAQIAGFASSAPTARFIAKASTAFFLVGFVLLLPLSGAGVWLSAADFVFRTSIWAAVGVWTARTFRRWFGPRAG